MKKILLLFSIQLLAWQAMAQVSGTVVDENNQSLIGVSVLVVGTNTGTITDLDGHFDVKAGQGDSLRLVQESRVVVHRFASGEYLPLNPEMQSLFMSLMALSVVLLTPMMWLA